MSTPPASVSVVVPTYRRRDRLDEVVRPLLADPATLEVVVVVDGSDDGSLELLQTMAAHEPRVVPLGTPNAGGAAARQHGIDRARGQVVLLLDDDVVATPGMVSGHARHHASAADLVVLGHMPVAVPPRRHPSRFSALLYAGDYDGMCRRYDDDPGLVLKRLWGGNVSLRRESLRGVPFDSGSFRRTNHSDRDFGLRCAEAGLRGRFDRSLLAAHHYDRPAAAFARDARRQGAGRYGVHRLHAGRLPPFTLADTVADLPRPVRALVQADRVEALGSLARAALLTLTRVANAVGADPVATTTARLLRRLELRRGVRDATAAEGTAPSQG
ncbi:glycosyltransferase [Jannaschia sp. R86511]|uniref:glycosyltransferase n=1 Tax=Jannaschia sp. R86511 TaxID=3093853 RepID=UPI0036D27D51